MTIFLTVSKLMTGGPPDAYVHRTGLHPQAAQPNRPGADGQRSSQRGEACRGSAELLDRVEDDVLDRPYGIDAPGDLPHHRHRRLHVTAEVELHRRAELGHVDVVLVLEA